jgi:HD-GYP domain-containing protein (c-di-GMP phosphodiesterase class II)
MEVKTIRGQARPEEFGETLGVLVGRVNEHDTYTGGHSSRVADIAAAIGRVMGMTSEDVAFIRQAGLVHDIGKIGIPESLLKKQDPLTPEEFELVKLHPMFGASILARIPGTQRLLPVVLNHHERWDGKGYPNGVGGTDIPIEARIIFVADSLDAMTTARPYGGVKRPDAALAELSNCSGTQFDPMVIDAVHHGFRQGSLDYLID